MGSNDLTSTSAVIQTYLIIEIVFAEKLQRFERRVRQLDQHDGGAAAARWPALRAAAGIGQVPLSAPGQHCHHDQHNIKSTKPTKKLRIKRSRAKARYPKPFTPRAAPSGRLWSWCGPMRMELDTVTSQLDEFQVSQNSFSIYAFTQPPSQLQFRVAKNTKKKDIQ